jgi:hypothetical protein
MSPEATLAAQQPQVPVEREGGRWEGAEGKRKEER